MFGEAAVKLVSAAARLLGWTPDQFWNATPAELASALGESAEAAGMSRSDVDALRQIFPD